MSSSSSPASKFSQIAYKFKRPDKESLEAWRASDEIKKAIKAKEAEIAGLSENIRISQMWIDHFEGEILEKRRWIRDATDNIQQTERWIRDAERTLAQKTREMTAEVKEKGEKMLWIEAQKKKYPYEYPEWQFIDD